MEKPAANLAADKRRVDEENLCLSAFWKVPEPPSYDSIAVVDAALDALPDVVETLKQALLGARTQAQEALVQTALVSRGDGRGWPRFRWRSQWKANGGGDPAFWR